MKRRKFLKLGAVGTASALVPTLGWAAETDPTGGPIELSIEPVDYEMIDGEIVYMIFFFTKDDLPHAVLRVKEGDTVEIRITNNDTDVRNRIPHAFAITGIPQASTGPIPPGETRTVRFTAPRGGSYLYHDPTNAPLNRVLGLYGAFVVAPLEGRTPTGSPTPYSRDSQSAEVRALFNALGRTTRFKGNQWVSGDHDPEHERDKVWVVAEVDPELNARVEAGEPVLGSSVVGSFVPRYFHINAISGFDTADHAELPPEKRAAGKAIEPEGCEGQPTLLRTINAGLCTHAMHIHGNGVFDLTRQMGDTVACNTNIFENDTWLLPPMGRKDMLLPFEKPPDIPDDAWPPKDEPFPLRYVMHCHCEMSQTAGGGNYPQGLVTHWEMLGTIEDCPEHEG